MLFLPLCVIVCAVFHPALSDNPFLAPNASGSAAAGQKITVVTVGKLPVRSSSAVEVSVGTSNHGDTSASGQLGASIDFSTGWDLNRGNNLFSLPSDSYISCRERCKNMTSCGAVVFLAEPNAPSCYGKDISKRQWSINPQARALLMKPIDNQEHSDQWDINSSDIGLFSLNGTTSFVACSDKCEDTPTCNALVFNAYYNRCIGKSVVTKQWSGEIHDYITAGTLLLDSAFDAAHSWLLSS